MATPKIFESESRFCLILWEREPVSSAELAKICKEKLGWSRTTTYTVIHRLSERGVVKNEGGLVSSLVSKDEAQAAELDWSKRRSRGLCPRSSRPSRARRSCRSPKSISCAP